MNTNTKEESIQNLTNYLEILTSQNRRMPNTHQVKLKLIKLGILQNVCSICSITSWNGKPLSLHLDHRDGNPKNNLLSNLRILCPNCHSQTETYCGKNVNLNKKPNYCLGCNKVLGTSWSVRCAPCFQQFKFHPTKITWPSKEELTESIRTKTMVAIEKELGVSIAAIKKHCKKVGIDYQAVKYFNPPFAGK